MKKIIFALLLQVLVLNLFAHEHGHGAPAHSWELKNESEIILADFNKQENGFVYLSDANHRLLKFEFGEFSEKDQRYLSEKSNWIQNANRENNKIAFIPFSNYKNWLILIGILMVLFSVYKFIKRSQFVQFSYGALGMVLILTACVNSINGNVIILDTKVPANNIDFLNSIFGVFDKVNTRHDDQYFYIESDGLPNHEMMTGITNWQQQVPIPHDYSGKNSWAIPLRPQLVAHPLSTKENFMKGAIAIAANGIPIFNPLNNRGEDANAIGELDRWGGHCGRADDYHYHLAPTHLQSQVGEGKPIAYALDGFPVFGETTKSLDENLGRFNVDSSYQYHAVKEYPYLIAAMRGKVEINPGTRAPENEISPQAKTKGVRPALRPLRGAAITDFKKIQSNQHQLTYTLENQIYSIYYGWDDSGQYNFEFINPDGTSSKSNFQRK